LAQPLRRGLARGRCPPSPTLSLLDLSTPPGPTRLRAPCPAGNWIRYTKTQMRSRQKR